MNTKTQEKALKKLMKASARKPLQKRQACRLLCSGEDAAYSRSSDAASFVKDAVSDDKVPIEVEQGKLVRRDVEVVYK